MFLISFNGRSVELTKELKRNPMFPTKPYLKLIFAQKIMRFYNLL